MPGVDRAVVRRELEQLGADFSPQTLASYAYDASSYRAVPLAVCCPRSVDQVQALLAACHRSGVPVTARGAGTSMAGNAIGDGLVLDFSRWMNRVLDVDAEARTATVEPGLVLDDLQRHLQPRCLMFAPDPSSHSRATIGGMVGNDACGNHSVKYGRTSDHVVALDLVLSDGCRVVAEQGGFRAWSDADRPSSQAAERLNEQLHALVARHLAEIRLELGRIPRQVSGYQLHHLLPERGFDVAKALVGSEGSCAIVVGAKLALVPIAQVRLLVVLGYEDIVDAAADVPMILDRAPAALEGMDESIVETMRLRRGPRSVAGLPEGRAWLFVELEGPDQVQLEDDAATMIAALVRAGRTTGGRAVPDTAERSSLWHVRENGAGLATRRTDGTQTWAGWEDSAVAPAALADYLAELRGLMELHQLTGAFYGHFGAGCVHVRMDFELESDAGIRVMRSFVTSAAKVVARLGGSVSGEHGDGRSRSELLGILYSPAILHAFEGLKAAMDPTGIINPGIVVLARPLDAGLLQVGSTAVRQEELQFSYPHDRRGLSDAVGRCVGVGRCRSDVGGAMCPSFLVTHDEVDSTRGRARSLQEMVRGELVTDGWRSNDVLRTLDLCLSCKACASDCPVGVDMATYKSEFLHHHYRRRIRPRTHYSLGWLPLLARAAGWAPSLANLPLRIGFVRRLLARLGGVTGEREVPRFHGRRSAWRGLRQHVVEDNSVEAILFTDTFTRAFRPNLIGAAVESLNLTGVRVQPIQGLCCGLTWISTGQLGRAKKVIARTVAALDDGSTIPIVVLEPSCAAALAKDSPELLDNDASHRVARRITTYASMIDSRIDAGWVPPELPGAVALQVHCHEESMSGDATQHRLLRRMGVREIAQAQGCCGLAGNFGFERQHYATSMAVAELSLTSTLRTPAARETVLADGFSCQTQIRHLATAGASEPSHLAEVLAAACGQAAVRGRRVPKSQQKWRPKSSE